MKRRQPSWLPSSFLGLVVAASGLISAIFTPLSAAGGGGEIVIVAVEAASAPRHLRQPVGAAVRRAIADLAGSAALAGRRVRVETEDDGCSVRTTAETARRIATHRPALIVGHPCPGAAIAAAEVYRATGLLMIATGVRHPRLTRAGQPDFIFRLAGRDDRQGEAIAAWLSARAAGRSIAIVRDHSLQGRETAQAIERGLVVRQQAPRVVVGYTAGDKDHAVVVHRLRAVGAEFVAFAGQPAEVATILEQLRDAGLRVAAIGTDTLAAEPHRLVSAAGEDALVVMLPWLPAHARDGALAYAAVELWAAAVAAEGSTQADQVARSLRNGSHATSIATTVRFDANGDADVPPFVPHRWAHGSWVPATGPP